MRFLITLVLIVPILCYSQDSIVFVVGQNRVTIYKDGHAKRLPAMNASNANKFIKYNSSGTGFEATTGGGSSSSYAINVQALTSSPADGSTIYFGTLPKAPVTAANTSKIYIRQSGTIRRAEIYCYSGTAGTAEAWVLHIRKNNTTDTQIASIASATNERVFSNTNLSISVSVGDYIEIKSVNPTWATNPLTTIFGGYIYIENN